MDWTNVGIFLGQVIITALLGWWINKRVGKIDTRGEARKEENILILQGIRTIGDLSKTTAEAVRDGHANGAVTAAIGRFSEYKEKLNCYLINQNAENNH
jgi:hypothetical protein